MGTCIVSERSTYFLNSSLKRWANIRVSGVFFSCTEELPLAVLLLFCSEGDNIPDALTLVNQLNDWLHLVDNPVSGRQEFTACAAQLHQTCIRTIPDIVGQFSENHISISPPFPVAVLPSIHEIFLVQIRYIPEDGAIYSI